MTDINPIFVTMFTFTIALVVGEALGASFGLLFDLLYIRVFKLYEVPVGSVGTVGFVLGCLFGWLGGLISHGLLWDYGAVGGIVVGFLGASLPLILRSHAKPIAM
jgi:hypothetical protein